MGEALLKVGNSLLEESNLMLQVLDWIKDADRVMNRMAVALYTAGCPAGIYSAADLTEIVIQSSLLIKF